MNKLSETLYDALISGNVEAAKDIKAEIDRRFENSKPRSRESVIKFNTVLNDDHASAIKVYDFLNKELGKDWWEWEVETIYHVLWTKSGVALEDINRDKILAIRHLCNSDQAFWDWYEMNQVCLSFSGSLADFEFLKKPSPGMVINAVKAMNHIRPDRNGQFNDEVVKYICIMLIDDGIYTPPPSIHTLIIDKFKDMVSPETKSSWKKIYSIYQDMVDKNTDNNGEEMEDIQAKRIFLAEAAALSYGK